MTPSSFAVLHGAPGVEVGPSTYLVRVFLHLLALGGVAVLAYVASVVAGPVRAVLASD